MLTLKDFVKETLSQVSDAIIEFTEEKSATGANANPPLVNSEVAGQLGLLLGQADRGKYRTETIMPIEFDVAVSAEETEAVKGGGGLRVLSFVNAEGGLTKETVASSVSRVRFRIPLRLPDTGAVGQPMPRPRQYSR